MNKKEYHFKVLPYLSLKDPLIFNFKSREIIVASYKNNYKNQIPKEVADELDKWVGIYVDYLDKPLQDMSIVYFKDSPCHEGYFTEEEGRIIGWIINSICFVYAGISFDVFRSANNFISENISIKLPSDGNNYYSTQRGRRITGGLRFDKNKIRPFSYVTSQALILQKHEKEILDALEVIINNSEDKSGEYLRILRAIEWFNYANHEEMYEHAENQIIAMSIAFESLINTPNEKIAEYFKNTINQLVSPNAEIEKWAKSFYKIRSGLVHGGKIDKNELLYGKQGHVSHYYLSKLIFIDVLFTKLQILRLIEEAHFDKYLRVSRIDEYLLSNKERFEWLLNHEQEIIQQAVNSDFESKTFKLLRTINVEEESVSVDAQLCDSALQKANDISNILADKKIQGLYLELMSEVIDKIGEIKNRISE